VDPLIAADAAVVNNLEHKIAVYNGIKKITKI
jgi:hypothetical protein